MGDFSAMCGASGVPLYHRDNVRLLILQEGRREGKYEGFPLNPHIIDSTDNLMPAALPIRGTLSDFARLETMVMDPPARVLLDSLTASDTKGLIQYHSRIEGYPVEDDMPLDKYILSMQIGMKIPTFFGGSTQWVYTLISEEMWYRMMYAAHIREETETIEDGQRNAESFLNECKTELNDWFDFLVKALPRINAHLEQRKQIFALVADKYIAEGYPDLESRDRLSRENRAASEALHVRLHTEAKLDLGIDLAEYQFVQELDFDIRNWSTGCQYRDDEYKLVDGDMLNWLDGGDSISKIRFYEYALWIRKGIAAGTLTKDSEDWREMRDALAEMRVFASAMSILHRVYMPLRSAGQSRFFGPYMAFFQAAREVTKEKRDDWRGQMGEDEEVPD